MRLRAIVLALAALLATSSLASAQQQTGEIFGKVTDGSGALLPGVTVTLTGPVLPGFPSAPIPSGSSSSASRPWSTRRSSSPSVSARL